MNAMICPLLPLLFRLVVQFDGYSMVKPMPLYTFRAPDEEMAGEGVGEGLSSEVAPGVVLSLEPPVLQAVRNITSKNIEQNMSLLLK